MRFAVIAIAFICASFLNAAGSAAATVAPTSEALHTLLDQEWAGRFERDPFLAASVGASGYADRLPNVSPAAQARYVAEDQVFLSRLHAIDRASLSEEDKTSYDVFEFVLENRISYAAFRPWRIPFLSDAGFHTRLAASVEGVRADTTADYEAYIARLEKVGDYFDQHIANMRLGLAEGFSQPKAILAKIAPSFAAHAEVKSAFESAFYAPFRSMPEDMLVTEKERLRAAGMEAIDAIVLPAYRRLHRFFLEDYIPAARNTLGATQMPDGAAYYDQRVKFFTTTDITALEVHALGRSEVARIRSEMETIIDQVGFKGTFSEFLGFLRSDPQFYAKTPKALLQEAAWISKRIDEKLPAFFKTLPRMPYGVRAVPDEIAPNYTTGRYWDAIPGKRGGLFMVNTYALDKRPLYTLAALALHEGVPGHHLQNALSREIENVPEFRKELYVNAFGEGWGLYAEKLGIEMGIYETPYEHFGRLSYEMWRAGRLVVDTGLHAMGWSREQAVAFFVENSALSLHNINTEVDRYISWPGQALAYKMGELKILELRARAQAALGDWFDIRLFHDAILENGTLPLSLLEMKIDDFIRRMLAKEQAKP